MDTTHMAYVISVVLKWRVRSDVPEYLGSNGYTTDRHLAIVYPTKRAARQAQVLQYRCMMSGSLEIVEAE